MTGLQKIFFGVGLLAIIGLGFLVYSQMSAMPGEDMKQDDASDIAGKKSATPAEKPVTPEDAVDDILSEIDEDNSALSEEELGETSEIESEGAVVSDFGTIYDENEN